MWALEKGQIWIKRNDKGCIQEKWEEAMETIEEESFREVEETGSGPFDCRRGILGGRVRTKAANAVYSETSNYLR